MGWQRGGWGGMLRAGDVGLNAAAGLGSGLGVQVGTGRPELRRTGRGTGRVGTRESGSKVHTPSRATRVTPTSLSSVVEGERGQPSVARGTRRGTRVRHGVQGVLVLVLPAHQRQVRVRLRARDLRNVLQNGVDPVLDLWDGESRVRVKSDRQARQRS